MSMVTEIILATSAVLILLGAFLSRVSKSQFHEVRDKTDVAEAERVEFIRELCRTAPMLD
jgi:hypothetical protein